MDECNRDKRTNGIFAECLEQHPHAGKHSQGLCDQCRQCTRARSTHNVTKILKLRLHRHGRIQSGQTNAARQWRQQWRQQNQQRQHGSSGARSSSSGGCRGVCAHGKTSCHKRLLARLNRTGQNRFLSAVTSHIMIVRIVATRALTARLG